jgi:hypothetical protein
VSCSKLILIVKPCLKEGILTTPKSKWKSENYTCWNTLETNHSCWNTWKTLFTVARLEIYTAILEEIEIYTTTLARIETHSACSYPKERLTIL